MKMKTWHEINSNNGIDGYDNYLGNTDIKDMLVFLSQSRDSDILQNSNFKCGLQLLGGESDNVQVHRFGHWACGWFEQILINPNAIDKIAIAEKILDDLSNYPVIDELDYLQLEYDTANEYWQSCDYQEKIRLCRDYKIGARQAKHKNVPDDLIQPLSE